MSMTAPPSSQSPAIAMPSYVGYLNQERSHVLVSVHRPALVNDSDGFLQFAVTIESAARLQRELTEFLDRRTKAA